MTTTLLTAGIACIIAAIAGGGLKAFGIEIPALASPRRQIGLGGFGAALLAAAIALEGGVPWSRATGSTDPQQAGNGAPDTAAGAPGAADGGCLAASLSRVPAGRIKHVETGVADFTVVPPNETKEQPMAVVIEERRRPVGAVEFDFFTASEIFKINRVLDADCQAITAFENSSRGGDRSVLQNWDTLEVTIGGATYALRLGYSDGTVGGQLTAITR